MSQFCHLHYHSSIGEVNYKNKIVYQDKKITIKINNKQKHLGYFDTEIKKREAYDNYIIKNNLEFYTKNFEEKIKK